MTRRVIVELAVWIAASVLLCDHVLLRPALFALHLGREVLDPPPEARLPAWAAVRRALRRTSKAYGTITLGALAVVVIALVAGPWSGLVLIAVTALGLRSWRLHRNQGSAPSPGGVHTDDSQLLSHGVEQRLQAI